MLPSSTGQTVGMALAAMTIVAMLLIPKCIGVLVVTCSILSVQLGVVGYMTLWGVHYDMYSMVTLIMSIGFSVDFCAHTAYSFYSLEVPHQHQQSKSVNVNDPAKTAVTILGVGLSHVGFPILQGSMSTVLAVIGLMLTGVYVHVMFFKVVFLIMTIGALHAVVFLPVCMLIFETFQWPPSCCNSKGNQTDIRAVSQNPEQSESFIESHSWAASNFKRKD
jgi:multidrug efflux pump subunit AcrB